MPWWVWLLLAWCAIALLMAFSFAAALQLAERRDWARRGSPDRRHRSRSSTDKAA